MSHRLTVEDFYKPVELFKEGNKAKALHFLNAKYMFLIRVGAVEDAFALNILRKGLKKR